MKVPIKQAISYYRNASVAVKASLWFAVCSIVQKGISVLTMPIFTRIMSTEQYGRYNVFLTWYNILVILVTLNVHSEVFNKGLIVHSEERDSFTANQAGLIIALGLFWTAVYLPFHRFFNSLLGLSTVLVIFMILEIVGSSIVGLWLAKKRFEFDYKKIVRLTLSMAILNPVIGIIAVMMTEHKAEAKVISNAVLPIVVSIAMIFLFSRKGKLFGKKDLWKTAVLTSLPLVPHYLSLVLLNQSDKLMINHFTGSADAAIYSVAHSAGLFMTIINTSINGSFVPWAYDRLKNRDGADIRNVSNILLVIVAVVNIGLIWLAPEAIWILAAPQYSVAVWCLVPIAISVFFYFTYTLFVDLEIYYGANYYISIASVSAAVLNIILNFIFIPIFGYIAAGYTTLFSYFATMLLHMAFLRKVLKDRGKKFEYFNVKVIAVVALGLIVMSAIAMLLYRHTMIRLGIIALAAVIAFIKRKALISLARELKEKYKR